MKKLISFIGLIALLTNLQAQTTYKSAFTGDSVRMSYARFQQDVEGSTEWYDIFEIVRDTIIKEGTSYQKLINRWWDGVTEVGGVREDTIEGAIYVWSYRFQKEFLLTNWKWEKDEEFLLEGGEYNLYCVIDSVWSVDSVRHIDITCETGGQFGVFKINLVEGVFSNPFLCQLLGFTTSQVKAFCTVRYKNSGDSSVYKFESNNTGASPWTITSDTCFSEPFAFSILSTPDNLKVDIKIYPNPITSSQFRIDGLKGSHYYEIFDVLGASVQKGQLQLNENTINGDGLKQGIYWISFWSKNDAARRTAKFVVNER